MPEAELSVLIKLRDQCSQGLEQLENRLKSVGKTMTQVGQQMTMKLTAPLALAGIGALKMAGDFDLAFRQVNVMLQASAEEAVQYKARILEIATATAMSATDIASAYYQIVSAGHRGADSMEILEMAIKGAVGGAADATQTTAALTKAMNVFQLQGVEGASKAMDVFFGIVDQGLLSFEQMATAFPRAASNAAGLKISIEETGATLATLTKVLGTTEQAATATDAIFRLLISPSEAMLRLFNEWGVESGPEAIAQFGGLTGVLGKLRAATGGEVTAIRELFASDEAMKGILPLLTSSYGDYGKAVDAIAGSMGRTGQAFEEMASGPGFKLKKAMNDMKVAMIGLGDSLSGTLGPAITSVVNILKGFMDWFGRLPAPIKSAAIVVAMLVAAIGPALIVIGMMAKGIAALIALHVWLKATTLASAAATHFWTVANGLAAISQWAYNAAIAAGIPPAIAFGIAVNAAIWPLTLMVGVIAGVIAGIVLLIKNWDKVTGVFRHASQEAKDTAAAILKVEQEVERLTTQLERENAVIAEHEAALADLQAEYSYIEANSAGYRDEVIRLNGEIKTHTNTIDELKAAISGANEELTKLTSPRLTGMGEAEAEIQGYQEEIDKANLALLQLPVDEREAALAALEARRAVLVATNKGTDAIDAQIAKLEEDMLLHPTLRRQIEADIAEWTRLKSIAEAQWKVDFDPLLYDIKEAIEEAQGLNEEFAPDEVTARIETQAAAIGLWTTELDTATSAITQAQTDIDIILGKVTEALAPLTEAILDVSNVIYELGVEAANTQAIIDSLVTPAMGPYKPGTEPADFVSGTPDKKPPWYDIIGNIWPFQHGGIVTKPTLAMIGEAGPEAVIPLSKMGSAQTYNITIQAGAFLGTRADAARFTDFIIQELRQKQRYAAGAASW